MKVFLLFVAIFQIFSSVVAFDRELVGWSFPSFSVKKQCASVRYGYIIIDVKMHRWR
mgnify:CR=1 FL=1